MTHSPYTPPSSQLADQPVQSQQMPRPRQVVLAVGLLWISLVIAVPDFYLTTVRDPDIYLYPAAMILTAVGFAVAAVLNIFIYRGRNWARIVFAVFLVLGGLSYLVPSDEVIGSIERVLEIVAFVLDFAALYLLFFSPSAAWFRQDE